MAPKTTSEPTYFFEVDPTLPERPRSRVVGRIWGVLRLLMGWIFLWAFLDKAFALGFATGRNPETDEIDFFAENVAWLNGGSPTKGFLLYGTKGVIGEWYRELADCNVAEAVCGSNDWIDWVYMISMLLIGLGLIFGVMTRLAAIGGFIWMLVFYTAALWPENNPFVDDHIVEAVVLLGIMFAGAGYYLGLGRWWARTPIGRAAWLLRG